VTLLASPLDPEPEPRECFTTTPAEVPDSEFAAACERHLDQVWRQLRAMGVPLRSVDDATQDVFLIAHSKFTSFEHRAAIRTWLYAITYRVGCNYRRSAAREPQLELDELEHDAGTRNPEVALIDKQSAEFVQRFADGLSEKLRDVFVLCLLEEQRVPEVAALLQLPENTVYSRIRLVREAFHAALARTTEA
jgi:RNA polymerase sigma-70 factor (ECF subfamily)